MPGNSLRRARLVTTLASFLSQFWQEEPSRLRASIRRVSHSASREPDRRGQVIVLETVPPEPERPRVDDIQIIKLKYLR